MFLHPVIHISGMRRSEDVAPEMERAKEPRRQSREENEKKGEGELPFQSLVHSENSVWMAESAMAYSFVCGELSAASVTTWR